MCLSFSQFRPAFIFIHFIILNQLVHCEAASTTLSLTLSSSTIVVQCRSFRYEYRYTILEYVYRNNL